MPPEAADSRREEDPGPSRGRRRPRRWPRRPALPRRQAEPRGLSRGRAAHARPRPRPPARPGAHAGRGGWTAGRFGPPARSRSGPRRPAAGGEVRGPGDPDAPVQFIAARDLAAWLVRLALEGPGGTFNSTGPAEALTFSELLDRAT